MDNVQTLFSRKVSKNAKKKPFNIDGFVKSRHPVEKRGPGVLQLHENTGFPPSRE